MKHKKAFYVIIMALSVFLIFMQLAAVAATSSQKMQTTNFIVYSALIVVPLIISGFVLTARANFKKILKTDKLTDFETGIGNLLYFENSFHSVITDENRHLYYIAYIAIDSNYLQMYHSEVIFKDAIKFTANILASYTREGIFAAKTSENGFALAFPAKNRETVVNITEDIMHRLNSYISTDEYGERYYFSIAVYNLDSNDTNSEVLLYNLRKRCSEIMDTKTQIIYFDGSIANSITKEKELLEGILSGLKNNEFKLYVQFVVNNKTKEIVSAEALSRWDSPYLGLVYPREYIGIMENSGHISRLDYYMFEACCIQLHKWQDTEFDNLTLSCNITRTTLSEPDFMQKIQDISQKYVFKKEKLYIEITEESVEKSLDRATENVRECKKMGFGISLDDMGTGYTSLLNLCDYPIDIVKIDREILLKTDTENGKGLFVGIVSLVHSLGMKIVCEGVETESQKDLVDKTDCDMVQGWYYSKVFPIREGEEFAKKYIHKKIH